MQFCIKPVDLYHYDIYKLTPIQEKIFGKEHSEKYLGYTTVSLDGKAINVFYENKELMNYYDLIADQTHNYYEKQLQSLN